MSQRIQFRRGTHANRTGIIPSQGEPIWSTDTKSLYIGDGSTLGGNLISQSTSGLVFITGNQTITGIKIFRDSVLRTHEIRNESGQLIIKLNVNNQSIYNDSGMVINLSSYTLTGVNACLVDWRYGYLQNNLYQTTLDWSNRVLSGNWQVATANPPTGNSNSSGIKGTLAISGGYLYACTGTNQWGRAQLLNF